MAIIRADASHLDPAWEIIERCRAALRVRGIDQWDDVYPDRSTVADDVAGGRLFVLTAGPVCQGIVTLDPRGEPKYAPLPWNTAEPALVIHRLCVDPDTQHRGLGQQLMDFAEHYAADQGYASLRLDAYSGNAEAMSFYRRRGYREVGQMFFPRRALPFVGFERATALAAS